MPTMAIPPIQRSVTLWKCRQSRPAGLFEHGRFHVRNADAALDRLELLQQLLLLHGIGRRIDHVRLLRRHGSRYRDNECERQRAGDQAHMRNKLRHAFPSCLQVFF